MIGDNGDGLQNSAKTGGLGTDHLLVVALTLLMGGSVVALVGQHTAAQAGPAIVLSLLLAAGGLALGTLLTIKVALPSTEVEELTPSLHWPTPLLSDDLDRDSGPVMVTVEYHVEPDKVEAFQHATRELEAMRKRNGALSWGLMRDSADPHLWLEFFFEESWLEHLRHHHRVTRGELKIEARVRMLQTDGVEVRIRHLLAGGEHKAHH